MARRVEIVTECEHGRTRPHPDGKDEFGTIHCRGGSRRVLEPGEYVVIEADPDNRNNLNLVAWLLQEVLAKKLREHVTWGDAASLIGRLANGPDPEKPWLPSGWEADAMAEGEQDA